MLYLQIVITQNYILFKILASGLFSKYPKNFANFSLDIHIKHILIKKKECDDVFVFRRNMDEGNIDALRFMKGDTERCRIRMYVEFRGDVRFNCINLCLLQDFSVAPLH